MMAKLGKYSTGLAGSAKNAPSPYGQSNKGWDGRSNMSAEFKSPKDVVMSKTTKGTTGRPVPVKRG